MSVQYGAVYWNRQKKIYDRTVALGVVATLGAFVGVGASLFPNITAETLIIRAVGTTAFLLLHVILSIGPLCRIDDRFLPLLYNRRHLGVCMFLLALVHGGFAILQFHGFGDVHPLVSLLTSTGTIDGLALDLPFQTFGLIALLILAVMASTSHDFWLANLTAPVWKAIHMGVYFAYALLVLHVSFGVLQSEPSPIYPVLLAFGVSIVFGLHIAAALREWGIDRERGDGDGGVAMDREFVDVCAPDEIEDGRARVVTVGGERVAVFRHGDQVSALSNVCQHQNGPLGEGRIIDGCVTCPWHGYQYDPITGESPPPFKERVPTFDVKLEDGRILVSSTPNPPGTSGKPAMVAVEAEWLGESVPPIRAVGGA